MKQKIGFIGLGLIGGSIAKAVRQYYPDYEIVAFDKNKEALALATQESVIDVAATTIDNNFHNCNYIFLCAPVASNTAYLKQLTEYLDDDCILTDVGSVKANIHEEVQTLGIGKYFIGGHPMAGSEKSGYSNSKAMLILIQTWPEILKRQFKISNGIHKFIPGSCSGVYPIQPGNLIEKISKHQIGEIS